MNQALSIIADVDVDAPDLGTRLLGHRDLDGYTAGTRLLAPLIGERRATKCCGELNAGTRRARRGGLLALWANNPPRLVGSGAPPARVDP